MGRAALPRGKMPWDKDSGTSGPSPCSGIPEVQSWSHLGPRITRVTRVTLLCPLQPPALPVVMDAKRPGKDTRACHEICWHLATCLQAEISIQTPLVAVCFLLCFQQPLPELWLLSPCKERHKQRCGVAEPWRGWWDCSGPPTPPGTQDRH